MEHFLLRPTNLVDQYSDLRLFFCDEVDYTITSVPPCRKIYASYDSKFMGFFPGTFDAPLLTISASRFVVYFAQLDYYGAGWFFFTYPAYGFKFTATGTSTPGSGWDCSVGADQKLVATGLCDVSPGWTGVGCSSGKVVTLALPGLQLSSTLPHNVGDLSQLISLDLSKNY
jgi:hypothetical protein